MLKSMPTRRSRCYKICYIKKELIAQITVRNDRKYVKGDDKEKNRPLKFKDSCI